MIEGLSPRAQRLINTLSQDEARKTGSVKVLPEHLILALLKSADGLGYSVLRHLRINILMLRLSLEQGVPINSPKESPVDIPASRRLSNLLEIAAIESRLLRHDYIGTEHLLLASLREEQSLMNAFFTKAGVSIEAARNAVLTVKSMENSSTKGGFTFSVPAVGEVHARQQPNQGANQHAQKPQNQSLLKEFSRDLTAKAKEGSIDPVIGREQEIQRVIQILSRRTKNNPVLVGEPGVGKTAIVEGLASRIVTQSVPRVLLNKRILTLDIALVIAGTKYRGEFEERMKRIMKEITEEKDIIVFIDELHTIIGAGGSEGSLDASNMLKPALSRGELQCIGATTSKEYRKYFERDAALERRFQVVRVEEPSEIDTRLILDGLKKQYEEFHGVRYDSNVVDTIVRFSKRYITDRFLPDKAIDVLDEAGAMKKIQSDVQPPELAELEKRIQSLNDEKLQLVQHQDYERAAEIRDEVRKLRELLEDFRTSWQEGASNGMHVVDSEDVCKVLSTMTGIPLDSLSTSETDKLINMEAELHKTVIGQDEAIKTITSAVRRARIGVSSTRRPQGSFIFLGPTGVGKTLLAKTLAKFLFNSEDSLIRIDMSDYMEKHNASRLVGAPPGYVGYDDGGVLTEKVRRNPYSVILLDEIEKAHPDVFNLLLQVLEEGELRDNLGHTVNFRNTVIIMTSNAGARKISNENRLGFNSFADGIMHYDEIKSSALAELKRLMSPELLNRIDDVIVFTALSKEEVNAILDIQLAELSERLAERTLNLKVRPAARTYLIENGYEPNFGARPMRRLIQREIEDPLAMRLLQGDGGEASTVIIDYKNDSFTIKFQKERKALPSNEVMALPTLP